MKDIHGILVEWQGTKQKAFGIVSSIDDCYFKIFWSNGMGCDAY